MDAAIPAALDSARQKVGKHRGVRDVVLAEAAKLIKAHVFPFVLRPLLTPNALDSRIEQLNKGKPSDDPTRVWVCMKPKPKTEPVPEVVPAGPPVVLPPEGTQRPTGIFAPDLALLIMAKDIRAMSQSIIAGQKDTADLAYMQVEALDRLTVGIETLMGTMARMNDRLDLIEGVSYARNEVPLVRAPKVIEVSSKPKNPVIPAKMNEVTEIERKEVCWGDLWEKLTNGPLTKNELHWQRLYPILVQKWGRHNFMKTDVPTVIVFGWYPTVQEAQQLFYRLGAERLHWISTYSVGKNVDAAVNRITPRAGQIGLLIKHLGHADPRALDLAKQRFKEHGIPYYRTDGKNVNCDDACYHFITRVFSRDWELYQQMAFHADTPKEVNGHHLPEPLGTS
jgi:hypothetical protein